jgi:hypothetical protein
MRPIREYTTRMRLFVVILLVNALMAMPLIGFGLSERGCCRSGQDIYAIDVDVVQPIDKCCGVSGEQSEDNQPEAPAPCDDGECPMTCCATTASAAFVLPSSKRLTKSFRVTSVVLPSIEMNLGQPHLLRLKRPPRTV